MTVRKVLQAKLQGRGLAELSPREMAEIIIQGQRDREALERQGRRLRDGGPVMALASVLAQWKDAPKG